jgi:hypothetical protein
MEPAKSQRPSAAKVAGSAVLVCALLVGAAYFLHDDNQRFAGAPSPRPVTVLDSIVQRCEESPEKDEVDGRVRTRCGTSVRPSFTLEVIEENDAIYSAKVVVPMYGTSQQRSERIQLGLEMFGLVADTSADAFLPAEDLAAIGTRRTRAEFEGRAYTTGAVANVALIFAVTPPEASPPLDK